MALLESSGEEVLLWRRELLTKGGRAVDLDWLLDIGGGVRWSRLQQIHFDPSCKLILEQSLDHLAIIWQEHLDNQIPLQHLLGRCPWRDFELEISSAALIPRQETELLMDLALQRFDRGFSGLWADLGTGSGALAVALARSFPNAVGHAVDLSDEALSLAQRNLKRLAPKASVDFHLGSWWEPLKSCWGAIGLVLANPPYIPTAVVHQLEPIVRQNEPYLALCGGPDGLNACREIVNSSSNALSPGGWLIIEHHHDQSDDVLTLMSKTGLKDVAFETDLNGIKRFALGRNP